MNKSNTPGWGAAQLQIREAVHFLCAGKSASERAEIAEELVDLIRAIVRGDYPDHQSSPFDREEHQREGWARGVAHHLVDGALAATERSGGPPPSPDQVSLLREIAKRALWHMPNSAAEARQLVSVMTIENLRQPHPKDDPPGRD